MGVKESIMARKRRRGAKRWTRRLGGLPFLMMAALTGGCGAIVSPPFAARLVGSEGQTFTVNDLESITNDPDLDDDGKRQAFRDLGLEDERLIEALLGL